MGLVPRVLREPLVHFVILGAALFALYRVVAPAVPTGAIVVTAALQRGFQQEHLRRHGRLPTPAEMRAIIARYVDTEVMLREALALGLDRGDIIVRRRLVQKMEFLNQGTMRVAPASDAELQAVLDRHPERYLLAGRATLEHVFVSSHLHPDDALAVAANLRERIAAGEDPVHLGDPFLRGREFRSQTEGELAGVFGPGFARALEQVPLGEWAGPIASSFGQHLVRVSERSGGRPATVAEVRRELERDFDEAQRTEAARLALEQLRARYDVRIEPAP
jgi:peptidyl-prolyl cis-trans isomerase C